MKPIGKKKSERLAELARRVAAGDYAVDLDRLAARMIDAGVFSACGARAGCPGPRRG
jgi:hypothetical protein